MEEVIGHNQLNVISSFIFSGVYYKVSTGEYNIALKLQKVSSDIVTSPRRNFNKIRLPARSSSY